MSIEHLLNRLKNDAYIPGEKQKDEDIKALISLYESTAELYIRSEHAAAHLRTNIEETAAQHKIFAEQINKNNEKLLEMIEEVKEIKGDLTFGFRKLFNRLFQMSKK